MSTTATKKRRPKVCDLPPEWANSYKGYAVHVRKGKTPCVGCTAAASKEKGKSNARRAAIRKETMAFLEENHPKILAKAVAAAEAKYPKDE